MTTEMVVIWHTTPECRSNVLPPPSLLFILKMEAESPFEMSVNTFQTTQSNICEDRQHSSLAKLVFFWFERLYLGARLRVVG
jgi:hypothetical protein